MRGVTGVVLLAVLLLGAGLPGPAAAQTVTVIVDGRVVAFDQAPAVIGGRLLVPLRGVFERLGATVDWYPEQGLVVARRGPTVVVLQPGSRFARVDGQPITLDVSAVVLRGRTLVPLRFISEALGAGVDWDPATRTVYVTASTAGAIPPAPAPQPVNPVPPFVPPPAPAPVVTPEPIRPPIVPLPQPTPTVIEGTVARLFVNMTPMRLHVLSGGNLSTIVIRSDTAIFVTEVTTGRTAAAAPEQIRRGDLVRVTLDPQGQAMVIRASYREVIGRFEASSSRLLYLIDGQAFRLAEEVLFILDGREASREMLRPGMELTLRVNPQTNEVWEVRAQAPVPPRAPRLIPVSPRIDGASINASRPLGVGASLVLMLRGTAGGEATFDVAGLETGLRTVEGPAGVYTGRRAVRRGEAVSHAAVTLRLRVGGSETTARVVETVTIDGVAPEFTRRSPEADVTVRTAHPTIMVWFADRGPAGMNLESVRLWINGEPARGVAVTETSAGYTPTVPLPAGRVRVQARVADLAGNEATMAWTFIAEPPTSQAPQPTPPPFIAQPTPAVTPLGRVAPPVINGPKPGETISSPLLIRGTATAGHRVLVTIEYQGFGQGTPGIIGPLTASVGSSGTWEARVQLPASLVPAGQLTVTAVALTPSGARSDPTRVVIRWPQQRDPEGPGN